MRKLTYDHVNVVSAAATSCLLRTEANCSPVFKKVMRKHAGLLIEVKDLLEKLIEEPQFLCLEDLPEEVNAEPVRP